MARVKLMSAMAYDRATYEATRMGDPVIRLLGELPATSQPFNVNRVYKGPQGRYEESLLLLDPDNVVIWQSAYRFIELRGEMFEDLFRQEIQDDIEIAGAGEHQMVFLVDGEEAGRIPVFIDAAESVRTAGVIADAVATSFKKSSVLWLNIPQKDGTDLTRPAWFVPEGDKVFVITGGREQQLTNIEHTDRVHMTVKAKDIKAAIADFDADVRVLENASDEFTRVATAGLGARLNMTDGSNALDRWRSECLFVELTPRF